MDGDRFLGPNGFVLSIDGREVPAVERVPGPHRIATYVAVEPDPRCTFCHGAGHLVIVGPRTGLTSRDRCPCSLRLSGGTP